MPARKKAGPKRRKTAKPKTKSKPKTKRTYRKQHVGSAELRSRGLKKKPKIGRKSPAASALQYPVGHVMRGQDGGQWIVKAVYQKGKRTHRWVHYHM